MRINHVLAIIFAIMGLILFADLGLNSLSATGIVIDKRDATSGSGKGTSYRYEAMVQTDHGVKTVSLDGSTFLEIAIGTHLSAYSSFLFGRTAKVELNGEPRYTTLNQAGTVVSIGFVACLILVIACLTLPSASISARK